jgi:AraC-like DNA-binding protein
MKTEQIWIRRPLQALTRSLPLIVPMAGNGRLCTGCETTREKSDVFAIEYVCRGDALLIQENKKYIINKEGIYLLRKGVKHTYMPGPSGIVFKRYISIDGVELENLLRYLNLWGKDTVTIQEPHKITRLLKEVTELLQDNDHPDTDLKLSCLAYKILLVLSQTAQPDHSPLIEKALAFMHQNLHQKLSTKTLSRQLGLSDSHFRRLFTAAMHTSPLNYFNELKLGWAANLLKTSSLTIKEVADKIGYNDPLYFSAQFKKLYGHSPRTYRVLARKYQLKFN